MRFLREERASVAVEVAMCMTFMFSICLLGVDMYRVGIERTRLEHTANSVALNVAAQPELTRAGLDSLAEIAMQGHKEQQQIIIMNVMQSGEINWQLERGEASELCTAESDGVNYTGELPEDEPEKESDSQTEEATSTASFIVVRACRNTKEITAYASLLMPDTLQVQSIYRASARKVSLDEQLQAENQAESEDAE